MDERRLRIIEYAVAAAMLACAAIYFVQRPASEAAPMPDDARAIAQRLAAHPADWRAASALTEHALDAPSANRFALWRAANHAAIALAPDREAPRMAFAKSAFFHWQELTPADRTAAIAAMEPLLHDEPTFFRMAEPLFELTGDFAMLRRAQPRTLESLMVLESIAATYGRFDDYRSLRDEVRRRETTDFFDKLHRVAPAEVIGALPPPPYRSADEPAIVAALSELHQRPLDTDPHRSDVVPGLIDYVVRHHLRPLDGIDVLDRSPQSASELDRLRLAQAAGRQNDVIDIRMATASPLREPQAGQWQRLDGEGATSYRAWIDRDFHGVAVLTLKNLGSDDVPPYVEIYFDDERISEGEVRDERSFALPPAHGMHRLEVSVANPRTRNGALRRVKIVSVAP